MEILIGLKRMNKGSIFQCHKENMHALPVLPQKYNFLSQPGSLLVSSDYSNINPKTYYDYTGAPIIRGRVQRDCQ